MEEQLVLDRVSDQDRLSKLLDLNCPPSKGKVLWNLVQGRGNVLSIWLINKAEENILGIEIDEDGLVRLFVRKDGNLTTCTISKFGQALENARGSNQVSLGYDTQSNISTALRFITQNRLRVLPPQN